MGTQIRAVGIPGKSQNGDQGLPTRASGGGGAFGMCVCVCVGGVGECIT